MFRYALRRILLLIPMIFAASVIIFLMLRLGTGDPALDYLRLTFPVPVDDRVAIPLQTKQALLLFKVFK